MGKMNDVEVYVSGSTVKVVYKKDYKMGYDGFGYHSHEPPPPDGLGK
ncbi:MAG: hypothetical protein ACP5K5_01645 [Candidatus Micrarchaeia archaeon]